MNYWKKASILIDRAFLNKRRDPSPVKVNVGFTIIICILVDLIFARLGNDYDDIQNIVGVLFYISIHFIMIGNGGAAIEFPSERSNFLRENSQGLYNSSTYYLAKLISEFPFQILLVTVSSVLFYYPLGLNETFTKFLVFYLVCLLSLWIGIGLGYCTGLMCPNEQIASMTAPMIVAPLASFGGMFASVKSMNKSFS